MRVFFEYTDNKTPNLGMQPHLKFSTAQQGQTEQDIHKDVSLKVERHFREMKG